MAYVNPLKYLERIQSLSGSKQKLAYIAEHKAELRSILVHLFNDRPTGISDELWSSVDHLEVHRILSIDELIKLIDENPTGSRLHIMRVKSQMMYYDEKLIYYLATKDVQLGVGRKSLQKIYPELREFTVQLAKNIEDVSLKAESFLITEKLDGVNLTAIKKDNEVRFFTRNGKEVLGLTSLSEEYMKLPDGVYGGEALYTGQLPRKERYRMTAGEINSDRTDKEITHYLFSYLTLDAWRDGKSEMTYRDEHKFLKEVVTEDLQFIKLPEEFAEATSLPENLNAWMNQDDREGAMLRYLDSVYEFKRSSNLLKIKPKRTIDLRVIDYVEHKHKNKLGALVVSFHGNRVNVGSGYTDEERIKLWFQRDSLLGKIIELQYMELSENRAGKKSLRFPVFLRLREDKDEESLS